MNRAVDTTTGWYTFFYKQLGADPKQPEAQLKNGVAYK